MVSRYTGVPGRVKQGRHQPLRRVHARLPFMAARGWRVAVGVSVAALLAGVPGACSGTGSSTRGEDTPQISLYRGGGWSVLSLKPPHLTGPLFNMILKDGVLTGTISGGTSPGGALHISIADDGADGHGPM